MYYEYNVQCLAGHVFGVKLGTALEDLCKERTALDALCLGPDECPGCAEQGKRDAEESLHMLDEVGCPMSHGIDEQCDVPGGCESMTGINDIKPSSYDGQVIWLPEPAFVS